MNKLMETLAELLFVFLFACFIALVFFGGMVLMPFAMAIVLTAAIREMLTWKRRINKQDRLRTQ